VLTTPAGTLTFNDGVGDQFYIQGIEGLVMPPLRTPIDDKPYGDGGLGHNFWKGGRHVIFDGVFLITSADNCSDTGMGLRNIMEEELRAKLDSIAGLTTETGTLAWTPRGLTARSLTVRCDVPLECPEDQDYAIRNFHFGLFSAIPDW